MPALKSKTLNFRLIAFIMVIAFPIAIFSSNGFTRNHTLTISKPIEGGSIKTTSNVYPVKERWTNQMSKVKMTADANIAVKTSNLAEYCFLGDANYDLLSTYFIVLSVLFTFCSMLGQNTMGLFKIGRVFFILTFWVHFGTASYTQHWFEANRPDLLQSGYRLLFGNDLFNIDNNHLIKRFALLVLTVAIFNMYRNKKGIAPAETRPAPMTVIKHEELQDAV